MSHVLDLAVHPTIVHISSYLLINAFYRSILFRLPCLGHSWYFSLRYFASPTSRSYGLLIFFSLIM